MIKEWVVVLSIGISLFLGLFAGMKAGGDARVAVAVIFVQLILAVVYLSLIRELVIQLAPLGLKRFGRFFAWRFRFPADSPVKCQCNFCSEWADLLKMKPYRRIHGGLKEEWLSCPRCEENKIPTRHGHGWTLIRRVAV